MPEAAPTPAPIVTRENAKLMIALDSVDEVGRGLEVAGEIGNQSALAVKVGDQVVRVDRMCLLKALAGYG